jgi:hypothetical protein
MSLRGASHTQKGMVRKINVIFYSVKSMTEQKKKRKVFFPVELMLMFYSIGTPQTQRNRFSSQRKLLLQKKEML